MIFTVINYFKWSVTKKAEIEERIKVIAMAHVEDDEWMDSDVNATHLPHFLLGHPSPSASGAFIATLGFFELINQITERYTESFSSITNRTGLTFGWLVLLHGYYLSELYLGDYTPANINLTHLSATILVLHLF